MPRPASRSTISIALFLLAVGCLTACSERPRGLFDEARETRANAYPENYKSDLLGLLRAYLNDPTGIRDAYIADPMMRSVGGRDRYVVCVRFNIKGTAGRSAGLKEGVAIFRNGRPDQFTEVAKEQCSQAEYKPFPELEKLTR
jgi:hypothetical protein